MYKKLKTVDFINMWLFIFEIEIFNFCICQKTTFAWSGLEQVSSWWINSKFCVYKVSIWRCLLMLTFSGLHFLFYMTPLNFQQGLVQPPVEQKWSKRITVQWLACKLMKICVTGLNVLPVKNMKKNTQKYNFSKIAESFSTANWLKTSQNLIFCSIKMFHRETYI